MATAIDLVALDEAGFESLYVGAIEPAFAAHETARVAAVRAMRIRIAFGAMLTLALAIAALVLTKDHGLGLPMVALFFGALITGIVAYQPIAKIARQVKHHALAACAAAMDVEFADRDFQPPAFARATALNLLPNHDRASFEDYFSGTRKNARFDLYEAHLEQRRRSRRGSHYVTAFRGQIIRLAFPRAFAGVTIVRRDAGMFNGLMGGPLQRVGLVDPKFETIFEVFSNDQVEARFLVHPAFMERLIDLETALHGKRLRCAFEEGDLIIVIEGGNLFEPGSMFKPLADRTHARHIVDDIAGVLRVMDAVLTAQAERPA